MKNNEYLGACIMGWKSKYDFIFNKELEGKFKE